MEGPESEYIGKTQDKQGGAKKAGSPVFGSSVVAPPISSALQNVDPGTQEWINARMSSIIEQLRQQYGDAAARRGMLNSGASEEEFAKAVQDEQTKVALEAANYNADVRAREDQQAHERGLARDNARSQENAAMFGGIAQVAPYAMFGKWGNDDKTLGSKAWGGLKDMFKTGTSSPASASSAPLAPSGGSGPVMPAMSGYQPKPYQEFDYKSPGAPAKGAPQEVAPWPKAGESALPPPAAQPGTPAAPGSPAAPAAGAQPQGFMDKAWDRLKTGPGGTATDTWNRVGAGALGTGVGTMLSSNKNKTGAILAGLGSTGLGARAGMSSGATGIGSALASGMFGSIKGNMLSGKNLWKTLVGTGAMAGSAGLFGKF